MSVTGRRTRVGYEMVERAGTKTAAGARVVDLDPATVDVLRAWRKAQGAKAKLWGVAYVETGYVFTAENGEPLHADHLAQRFERLVAAAGGTGDPLPRPAGAPRSAVYPGAGEKPAPLGCRSSPVKLRAA